MDFFERYEVIPLQIDQLPGDYQKWALDFFINPGLVANPYIDITVQLDITSAVSIWQEKLSNGQGTLTAWLIWNLLQSLKEFPCFQWRYLDGQWFEVKNPPLFCPIAVDRADRFVNLILENAFKLSWEEFAGAWVTLKRKIQLEGTFTTSDTEPFRFCQFIGNLPHLHFTSLTLHQPASSCQPFFYFGQRRCDQSGLVIMPLAAKFHHSSCDPDVFDRLLRNYQQRLQQG